MNEQYIEEDWERISKIEMMYLQEQQYNEEQEYFIREERINRLPAIIIPIKSNIIRQTVL